MRAQYLLRVAFVAVASALAAPAFAAPPLLSALFPDPFGIYYSTNTGFYPIPAGGLVTLEGVTLTSPTASIAPPAAPGTSVWAAGATFSAFTTMSFFGGPTLPSTNVDTASASITGLLDAPPVHTYATEMLSLNLGGLPFGAMIRESPTLASSGGHTILETAPSGFQITSFFDVFTELSIDSGATWIPATGPVHIQNPEPGSLALLASAAAPLICRRRRRAA